MAQDEQNGIYYFLGNTVSHILHALPLYRVLGGTFVVVSDKARRAVEAYDVPVINVDNKPYIWKRFGYKIKPVHEYAVITSALNKTVDYLNQHAKTVIFYDLFNFTGSASLDKPRKVFLTHGNMLKSYMNESGRLDIIKQYDYMAALGPYLKKQFIQDGVDQQKLVDIGVARTDELVAQKSVPTTLTTDVQKETGLDPSKKTVAYLPTFWGTSSIYTTGLDIVEHFPASHNLIFRPHPQTPKKLLKKYLELIKTRPHIIYAPEHRYSSLGLVEILRHSDVIIGDVSSVMLEAILLDRPLIFATDDPAGKDYAAIQEVITYSQKITQTNAGDIESILDLATTNGIDRNIWESTKDRCFFNPRGGSVDAIATFIKSLQ